MTTFEVKDMTCGHCVSVITKAVNAAAPGADVRIDLATHRVTIGATTADATQLRAAITEAGYTPMAVEATASSAVKGTSAPRSGCCCS